MGIDVKYLSYINNNLILDIYHINTNIINFMQI